MTNIDNFPTNLSPKEVLEKFYKQPLGFKVSKAQEKRWENVKPINLENFSNAPNGFDILNNKNKAIINQIKWTDKCSDTADKIKEEDIFYKGGEPITEPYEPKVGDRFENLNHREYEIIQITNNKCVLKNKYGCRTYTMVQLKDYIKGCHLKKIN